MAQTGFTPISNYYSATATNVPTAGNLVAGELAINTADGKLFYKDSAGVVQTLATKDATSGSFVNLAYTGTLTGGTGVVNLGSGQFYKDASGNVGIGVVPSAWASSSNAIQNNGGAIWQFGNSNIYLSQNYYYNGTNRIYITTNAATEYNQSGGVHRWYTAPSGTAGAVATFMERARIDVDGNLLVGTTSASALQNNNSFVVRAVGDFIQNHVNGTGSGAGYAFFGYNGGAVGSITQAGTTGVLYNVTSDYRLKTVIAPVSNSGTRLDALQPIEYDWKAGGRTRGFLAHQFAEVYPSSVSGEKDAVDKDGKPVYQGMQASTPEVMADLIAEIQSLRKRVAQLESK